MSCRKSQGRHFRHSSLNAIIHQSLSSASAPSRLESPGVFQSDGRDLIDGMSTIPWSSGGLLVCDATCSDTFAYSNLSAAVTEAGLITLQAEKLKNIKYSHLDSAYKFVLVAVETFYSFNYQTKAFFLWKELGHHLRPVTWDENSHQYFCAKKISVTVQRRNTASVVGSLPWASKMDDVDI